MHRGYLFRVRAVTIAVEIQNVKKLSRPVALGSISGGNDHGRLLFFPVGTTSVKPRDTGWVSHRLCAAGLRRQYPRPISSGSSA